MRCLWVAVAICLAACSASMSIDPDLTEGSDVGVGSFGLPDAAKADQPHAGTVWQVNFNATPLGEYTAAAIQADWGGNVNIENGVGTGRGQIIEGVDAFE